MKYKEEYKNEVIKSLEEFIKIPSISADVIQVEKALDYILDLASSWGFLAKKLLGGQVGVIEIGKGDETLGILAHVDVVDPGDIELWDQDPFLPTIKDNKMYGRGTLDDKGAIIATLFAMRNVYRRGESLKKKVQLILGTQEEAEWTDMEAYVKEYDLPDYGFTPDGEFPIGNTEKGCLDVVMEFPVEKGVDNDLYILDISAGTASNIVPGKCTVTLSNGEKIITNGKAVHSSMPETGQNAIFIMAEELKKYKLVDNKFYNVLYMLYDNFESLYGEEIGLLTKDEYYNGEFIHKNVFVPAIIKTKEDTIEVTVNIRFAFTTKPEDIISAFDKIAKVYDGKVMKSICLPAVHIGRHRPFLKCLAKAYEEVTGLENEFKLAYGGSYSKAMPNIVSWGPIFPNEEDTCHQENEYISLESLFKNIEIFENAISKIALSDISLK